jgi:hypothetical protein
VQIVTLVYFEFKDVNECDKVACHSLYFGSGLEIPGDDSNIQFKLVIFTNMCNAHNAPHATCGRCEEHADVGCVLVALKDILKIPNKTVIKSLKRVFKATYRKQNLELNLI